MIVTKIISWNNSKM